MNRNAIPSIFKRVPGSKIGVKTSKIPKIARRAIKNLVYLYIYIYIYIPYDWIFDGITNWIYPDPDPVGMTIHMA